MSEETTNFQTAAATSTQSVINLGPIQPKDFGWGQTAQFSLYVSTNGKADKNVRVNYWFSGQHSLESAHHSGVTNAEGRLTFTTAVPRSWFTQKKTKWADLNASCEALGVQKHWRVKG